MSQAAASRAPRHSDGPRAERPAIDGVRHRFVEARGLRFHIAEAGDPDRPLLLMLHGFPECWYSWRHQLGALGDAFHVVAPDLRGYNETDKPADGYDIDSLADDVAALIDATGHREANLVGHDWGGAITWHVARRHGDRLRRFAVLNCPPADVFPRALLRDPSQLSRSFYMILFQFRRAEGVLLADGAARVGAAIRDNCARPDAFSDEELAFFQRAISTPGAIRGALSYYRAGVRAMLRGRAATRPAPGSIALPALVIWGRDDPSLSPHLLYDVEQRFSEPLTIRLLPGVGHFPHAEAPDDVNAALRGFFA